MPRWRKVNSTKKHLWLLFHSAKSISYQFRTPKNFGIFFSKIWNFVFQTLYCIGEKSEINKKSFLVLFYSAKPISYNFRTLKNFENFSSKIWNFCVSTPILHRWKRWSQQKITFECSFIAQNPFQTILGLWKTLKNFRKNFSNFWNFLASGVLYWIFYVFTKNIWWVSRT